MIELKVMRTVEAHLPTEVRSLFRREREIASIIYLYGPATALEVADRLEAKLSNSALRSMLNRLVAKAILRRTQHGKRFVYSAALTRSDSRQVALRRFAQDYFGGSLERAAAIVPSFYSTAFGS